MPKGMLWRDGSTISSVSTLALSDVSLSAVLHPRAVNCILPGGLVVNC